MSRIPERVVADVVKEASIKMSDPRYANTMIDAWVRGQPAATNYMKSYDKELGAEAIVNMVFHAQLLASCFLRHAGRSVRAMTYADLDAVAGYDRDVELKKRQPALFDYLAANVEHVEMRRILTLLALGMDYVA